MTAILPRTATPRDRSRPNTAAAGAFVAVAHSREWLPWQYDTARLISETLPNGRMAYPIVVVLVPRQCGKTTFLFDMIMGRCLALGDYRCAYTAQTGHVTSERFAERMTELPSTPLHRRVATRRSAGTERFTFRGGSFLKAFPPKDGALRGSALDLVAIDEAQEIDELLGVALDQTILPTFTTRPRRQLILIGTAGTDASKYLARYLALARGGAAGVAVVEYGATPDDDPADPAVWHRVHPGLASGLTDDDALRSALAVMGPESFAREYLCVWQETGNRLVSTRDWLLCRRIRSAPIQSVPPVLAVDVAPDRSATAILAVWPDGADGTPVAEVVDYRPGTDWPAARLRDLYRKHRPALVVADNQGPVLTVVDEARRLKVPVTQPKVPEFASACQDMLDRIGRREIAHRGGKALDAAIAGAMKRPIGDGGWGWARRSATVDVSPLIAATLALWGHANRPSDVRPRTYAG